MRLLFAVCLSLLVVTPLAPAVGQLLTQPFASAAISLGDPPRASFAARLPAPARNYWREGAVIGAVALGVSGALLGHAQCSNTDVPHSCAGPTLVTAAIGAALGFGVGAFVGSRFHK